MEFKKWFMYVVVMLTFVSVGFGSSFKFENLIWLNNELELDNAFSATDGGAFYIERFYVTGKAKMSDAISARVTLDMVKTGDVYDSYFKYAYLDYKFSDAFKITAGLQKTYFGYLPKWKYALPKKHFSDELKILPSADLGLGFGGKLVDGKLSYHVQLLNGEGYKHWQNEFNLNYCVMANVYFQIVEQFGMGVSYKFADDDAAYDHALSVYADTKFGGFSTVVDFFMTMSDVSTDMYLTAVLGYELNEKWQLLVAGDFDLGNNAVYTYLGANWEFFDGVALKPMIGVMSEADLSYLLKLQLEVDYGFEVGEE